MKKILIIISALLFWGANSAHAQFFGWHGSVSFTHGASYFTINFSAPTYWGCENERSLVKSMYSPPAYTVAGETPCISMYANFRDFRLPETRIPWPDPGCLSCLYLREGLIEQIYPRDFERVQQLMDEYQIHEYNGALEELNSQFDLEGFGQEMYLLEMEIGQQ